MTSFHTYLDAITNGVIWGQGWFYSPLTSLLLAWMPMVDRYWLEKFWLMGCVVGLLIYDRLLQKYNYPRWLTLISLPMVAESNLDIFICIGLVIVWKHSPSFKWGVLIGLLTFKPLTVVVIPLLMYHHRNNLTFSWLLGIGLGIVGNWAYLGYLLVVGNISIEFLIMSAWDQAGSTPGMGFLYLSGIQYAWFWFVIVMTFKDVYRSPNRKYLNYRPASRRYTGKYIMVDPCGTYR